MDDKECKSEVPWKGKTLSFSPLHHVTHLMSECCALLNMEWKRSETARMRSISNSSDNFPASLLLIDWCASDNRVLGHCKLSPLPQSVPSVFVESVVIHPVYRGQGLGSLLMQYAEQYAKGKGVEVIYLSTQGQELFYKKLNYVVCPPVNIYGCNVNFTFKSLSSQNTVNVPELTQIENINNINSNPPDPVISSLLPSPPPPPQPPPPPLPTSFSPTSVLISKKTFMKKNLYAE